MSYLVGTDSQVWAADGSFISEDFDIFQDFPIFYFGMLHRYLIQRHILWTSFH